MIKTVLQYLKLNTVDLDEYHFIIERFNITIKAHKFHYK